MKKKITEMTVSIPSIVSLVLFYLLVLATGVLASWWYKRRHPHDDRVETSLVAGRSLKGIVGALTMIGIQQTNGLVDGWINE